MIHKHFDQLPSTQDYLLDNSFNEDQVLISCQNQTSGYGRHGRKWISSNGSLCFSCLLPAHEVMTLTSLELACLLHSYYHETHQINLALKWPNDILTPNGYKVAGIIINNKSNTNKLIIGIGLNYFGQVAQNFPTPYGNIFKKTYYFDKKDEARKIYNFIINRRMHTQTILDYWNRNCFHVDKKVSITQDDINLVTEGSFIGIGKHGQALININGVKQEFYTGSILLV